MYKKMLALAIVCCVCIILHIKTSKSTYLADSSRSYVSTVHASTRYSFWKFKQLQHTSTCATCKCTNNTIAVMFLTMNQYDIKHHSITKAGSTCQYQFPKCHTLLQPHNSKTYMEMRRRHAKKFSEFQFIKNGWYFDKNVPHTLFNICWCILIKKYDEDYYIVDVTVSY